MTTKANKVRDLLTAQTAAEAIDIPSSKWSGRCHEISLAILRAGLVPGGRVARGWCKGVPSQHSWIAASGDCYGRDAPIIDPTLWTYGGAPPDQIRLPSSGRLTSVTSSTNRST